MTKKFFTNASILKGVFIYAFFSIICSILLLVLEDNCWREILIIFAIILGSGSILLLVLLIFHCWVAEISEQGILYRNLFKFRKFKRFFSWEEIDEIEIIKLRVLNLKQTYFTRLHYSYGHKRFINMKDPDVIILNTASKKIQEEIKKHYTKNIITGRNFKIAIAQEEYEEKEKK